MRDVSRFEDEFSRQLVSKIDELKEIEQRRMDAPRGTSEYGTLVEREAAVSEEIRHLVLGSAHEDSASG